jgi:hypothetical protein
LCAMRGAAKMNYDDMMGIALDEFDDAVRELKGIVVDPQHLNHESREVEAAVNRVKYAIETVFNLKGIMFMIEKYAERNSE